jgi:hypothetical protein
MGKATVKMPRHEQPFSLWVLVRETPVKVGHTGSCIAVFEILKERAPR